MKSDEFWPKDSNTTQYGLAKPLKSSDNWASRGGGESLWAKKAALGHVAAGETHL